jgi:hypothetical protein
LDTLYGNAGALCCLKSNSLDNLLSEALNDRVKLLREGGGLAQSLGSSEGQLDSARDTLLPKWNERTATLNHRYRIEIHWARIFHLDGFGRSQESVAFVCTAYL